MGGFGFFLPMIIYGGANLNFYFDRVDTVDDLRLCFWLKFFLSTNGQKILTYHVKETMTYGD